MDKIKLRFLEQELMQFTAILGKAADTVLDQDISNYPIFVAHKQDVEIGIPIIDRSKENSEWNIHISTLEEFVSRSLIDPTKIDDFRKVYKPPTEQLCFFVLSEFGATFNFLPRKQESERTDA